MTSNPKSIPLPIQVNDYISVAWVTVISHDYILTFSDEVEYVWNRPWTLVSVMYLVLRYLGLLVGMMQAFGTVIFLFMIWGSAIVTVVTDLMFILRIYAMYNRSRIVLFILLLAYIPTMIILLVLTGIVNNPQIHVSVINVEAINMELCVASYDVGTELFTYMRAFSTAINGVLCSFAVVLFIRHSLEMHKVLRKWQSNRYMKLLVQEGILYFVVILLHHVLTWVMGSLTLFSGIAQLVLAGPVAIAPYILAPRFILGVRDFHSRILGEHVDSGFGLHSQCFSVSHGIRFASPEERELEGDAGAVEEVAETVVE
ncbi:hypothetical protein BU15DRAFT_79740 [Melanogaster broomeanus]|nr:hypothetical protein BU15DRAFT_79740 [Melanogaster broomeanus]